MTYEKLIVGCVYLESDFIYIFIFHVDLIVPQF